MFLCTESEQETALFVERAGRFRYLQRAFKSEARWAQMEDHIHFKIKSRFRGKNCLRKARRNKYPHDCYSVCILIDLDIEFE